MFNGKILILSPHMDDEVLGCGGVLAKTKKESTIIHVHYFNNNSHPIVDNEKYIKENEELIKLVGFNHSFSEFVGTETINRMDSVPIFRYIKEIETLINEVRPNTVLIPFPSYNQDHRVVYNAALTAIRPHDSNHLVKNILLYEQPETFQTCRIGNVFTPNVFLNINICEKIELYSIYATQIRGHRKPNMVKELASIRGEQCGVLYAESYMLLRGIL